jgi:hypothetical protein
MMINISELLGYVLHVKDGELGRCKDFLIDNRGWDIRYMVADTGNWLTGRKVLIAPSMLSEPEWSSRSLPVNLTREQIQGSPPLQENEPVTDEYEIMWFDYYGLAEYWVDEDKIGMAENPNALRVAKKEGTDGDKGDEKGHLLSAKEIVGWHTAAADGDMGHLADFLVEMKSWKVRYAILDTRNWLPGRQVCVSIHCVEWIDRAREKIGVRLTKEAVKNSPEYNPFVPMTEAYQVVLHDYYGWPKYWKIGER